MESIFKSKVFTTADGVDIITNPDAFVFETRVDLYRQMMEGGPVFALHVLKARIRSRMASDELDLLKAIGVPVLSLTTDYNERIILAITSELDDYELVPIWEMAVFNSRGIVMHRAGTAEKIVRLFHETVKQGQVAISQRKDILSGLTNVFMK